VDAKALGTITSAAARSASPKTKNRAGKKAVGRLIVFILNPETGHGILGRLAPPCGPTILGRPLPHARPILLADVFAGNGVKYLHGLPKRKTLDFQGLFEFC
jgi:hypothetical protein